MFDFPSFRVIVHDYERKEKTHYYNTKKSIKIELIPKFHRFLKSKLHGNTQSLAADFCANRG